MTQSTGPESMTKSEALERINNGFESLEQLWNQTEEIQEIHGLDSTQVTKVKTQVEQAYRSMQDARKVLAS